MLNQPKMLKNIPVFMVSLATGLTLSGLSEVAKAYTVAGPNPNDPLYLGTPGKVVNGVDLDGVGDLILNGNSRCTASRISATHALTAGHCVTDNFGNINVNSATLAWNTDDGLSVGNVVNITTHPLWNGDILLGVDLAIVELDQIADFVPTYEIYTGSGEIGAISDAKVGFGLSGTGTTGYTINSGTKRHGQNVYDGVGSDFFSDVSANVMIYDFDSGLQANNTLDLIAPGSSDLGLGLNEVMTGPGDSGGSTFIDGKIAGVTSFSATLGVGDSLSGLNGSFGELGGDVRVSLFNDFIQDTIGTVPEPLTILGSGAAIGFGTLFKRKLAKKSRKNSNRLS
ncbi:MAG TPA: hypothetical protein DCF68_23260 [Cyanothece sp. UBA12306]|nr:hypothetical protein [Cyanothece sp. UBA12306]